MQRPGFWDDSEEAARTSAAHAAAQRRYMRRRTSAQSCESVPPAPERTVTTASPAS